MFFFIYLALTFCTYFFLTALAALISLKFKITAELQNPMSKRSFFINIYSTVVSEYFEFPLHLSRFVFRTQSRIIPRTVTHSSSYYSSVKSEPSALKGSCVVVPAVTLCFLCWLWSLRSASWPHALPASPGWREETCAPPTPSTRTSLSSPNRSLTTHLPLSIRVENIQINKDRSNRPFHFKTANHISINTVFNQISNDCNFNASLPFH